jgi:ABC-type sulfate transport system substrate-binding protein
MRLFSFYGIENLITETLINFTGTLVGAYATNNNGNGTASAYLSRWRYTPVAQEIAKGVYVPVKPAHP